MLPALELDGKLITESDHILAALEMQFGPLYVKMDESRVILKVLLPRMLVEGITTDTIETTGKMTESSMKATFGFNVVSSFFLTISLHQLWSLI